jgi:hypothetical protein
LTPLGWRRRYDTVFWVEQEAGFHVVCHPVALAYDRSDTLEIAVKEGWSNGRSDGRSGGPMSEGAQPGKGSRAPLAQAVDVSFCHRRKLNVMSYKEPVVPSE